MPRTAERPAATSAAGRRRRAVIANSVLTALLLISVPVAVSIGTVNLDLATVWGSIGHHLGIIGTAPDLLDDQIVWTLRTPRVLVAVVVGAALSLAGVCLQAVTRNALADPFMLGVSSGAAVGAALVMSIGGGVLGGLGVGGAAFVGALASLLLVIVTSRSRGARGPQNLVLCGVAVAYLMSAATSLLQWFANPLELRGMVFWLMGSFAGATWSNLTLPLAAMVIAAAWLLLRARAMNLLAAGDDSANAMGIAVDRVRLELLIVSSLLTAAAVSIAGGIAFVGLMVPHICRLIVGPEHRRLLVASLFAGALLMVLVDLVARTAYRPNELPVGMITAALGAPFFIALLRRRKAHA